MKTLTAILLLTCALVLAGCLTGCVSGIKLPPGSLDYWHHSDTYGPYKDDVLVENAVKLEDGTFVLGHYLGSAGALGQGMTDELRNLHVSADGKPIPPTPASVAAVAKLRAAQTVAP